MKLFFLLWSISVFAYGEPLKVNSSFIENKKLESMAIKKQTFNDPVYKGKVLFTVVPLNKILKIPKNKALKFKAKDGFTSVIAGEKFLGKAKAFLAIETKKWPQIRAGQTAGPYYLLWKNAASSNIGQEQWPFQIVEITVVDNIEQQYQALRPKDLTAKGKEGFKVFAKNCFTCHKLNGYGEGEMGPDLNHPMNPTEYFRPAILTKFIRNPKSVRQWKGMMMPSFTREAISDKELKNLIRYLQEMGKHR